MKPLACICPPGNTVRGDCPVHSPWGLKFKPEIVFEEPHQPMYGAMLVELRRCPSCAKPMVDEPSGRGQPFPRAWKYNVEAQCKAAGWELTSSSTRDGDPICRACEASNLASFTCALCHEVRQSSQSKEAFGEPPEYLCTVCFETVPAKQWQAKVTALEETHRYDFD